MTRSFVRVVLAVLILLQGILAVGRGQHAVVLRECVDHATRAFASDSLGHGPGDHRHGHGHGHGHDHAHGHGHDHRHPHDHPHVALHSHGGTECGARTDAAAAIVAAPESCSETCEHTTCSCLHLHLDSGAALVETTRVSVESAFLAGGEPPVRAADAPRPARARTDLRRVGDHPPDRVLRASLASIILRF